MTPSSPQPRRIPAWLAYGLLGILSAAYAACTLLSPIGNRINTYGLDHDHIRLIQVTLVLPIIGVWFIALWGSLRFKNYAVGISEGADGRALNTVANGLLTLVSSLAVNGVVQAVGKLMVPRFGLEATTIITNYVSLGLSLIAFVIICRGAWQLAALVGYRGVRRNQFWGFLVLAVMGVLYAWLLAHNPDRLTSANPDQITPYYLSDWLLLTTIVIPYLVLWNLGLTAVAAVRSYQCHAKGIIYRNALGRLAAGLFTIIMALLLIQLTDAIGPSLVRLGLSSILFLIYLLIFVYAFGHVLVALGARRLAKIEEVR